MNASRQPLLTLSPSQLTYVSAPNSDQAEKSPQTTPTLPRRERLASFSRLVKKRNFSLSGKSTEKPLKCNSEAVVQPSVDIVVSGCSPPMKNNDALLMDDKFLKSEKEFLSPNRLPFSPKLLNRRSPISLSPSYRQPSPLRSPLYKPDTQRYYLGRGSFGKVSLCKYKDRSFAVKVTHHLSHFVGERNLLGIRHPHLVEIFCISTVLNKTLIFMEFAGHCNLQQILDTKSELDFRRKLRTYGGLVQTTLDFNCSMLINRENFCTSKSFCIQTASGLRHCHKNRIVHGDVKPANVMVSPRGICKLGDFGNSIKMDIYSSDKSPRPPEDVIGTAAYAAPEVLRGSHPSPSSDIYSYGILLWQMDAREMPFAGEHPHVIIYKVVNYGERPKFTEDKRPSMATYIKTAESCWCSVPEDRLTASQVLSSLQSIMQYI